jgi:multidrug resistance protein MdtO
MSGAAFLTDMLAPFDGRLARSLEITIAAMLVVVVSMTFQIPEPALSAYLIFFVAKNNSGLNILMSLVFIVVVTIIVALAFGLAQVTINAPEGRILVLAGVSFVAFFLGASSKLAPLASTMGLVIAYVLDLLGSTPIGEIATRGLLYAWLFAVMPMLVFIVYNLFFGRHPETLARQFVADRLKWTAAALRGDAASSEQLKSILQNGGAELEEALKMVKLLHRQSPDAVLRLDALAAQSYALALTVVAAEGSGLACSHALPARLETLAESVERLPRSIARRQSDAPLPPAFDLPQQIEALVTAMEGVVAGEPVESAAKTEETTKKAKGGFFVADAFSNPLYTRFAAKGTAAVMICYLTFTLLDWPGIHTCMLTCFIVSLTTLGETVQKLFLRIAGCLVGALLGGLAIVFLLPQADSITALVALIGLVTLPAAWIAVGKPSVSYFGFQMALALYLCILQGDQPKFDLDVARDRVIGILFGDVVVYLIFTRVFPVSTLTRLRTDLQQLVLQCRAVLQAKTSLASSAVAIGEAGRAYASIETLGNALAAYGYETWRSGNSLLRARATRRSVEALEGLVDAVGIVAAFPPPEDEAGAAALRPGWSEAEAQLQQLGDSLAEPLSAGVAPQLPEGPAPTEPRSSSLQAAALTALVEQVNTVKAVLFDYRQLLQTETAAHD